MLQTILQSINPICTKEGGRNLHNNTAVFKSFVDDTTSQSQKITNNNQRNVLKMTSSCI